MPSDVDHRHAPAEPGHNQPLLEIHGLSLTFGGVTALDQVDLSVERGLICGLVGPNGAGKTSLFNCICGYYTPTAGGVTHAGHDVTHAPPHSRARLGIARTFQHPVLQRDQSVLENVLVGGHSTVRAGAVRYALRLGVGREERAVLAHAKDLLDYLKIGQLAHTACGELSYGTQKRVELARALMLRPSLLLLDELASGLTHEEVFELGEQIRAIRSELDLTIVLVEHHMGLISAITDKVAVLVQGKKVIEGTSATVQRDPMVVAAYLGTAA
jgi:branched-chain amino acid transport system ATP-binding protein